MKCQFCNTNESDRIFYTNYMGALYQIPVCEGCLHRLRDDIASMEREVCSHES